MLRAEDQHKRGPLSTPAEGASEGNGGGGERSVTEVSRFFLWSLKLQGGLSQAQAGCAGPLLT